MEVIYEKLHYIQGLKGIVEDLSRSLAERFDLPGWGDWMEAKALNALLQKLITGIARKERSDTGSALGSEGENGLRSYVTGPLHRQMLEETGTMPKDITIVFDHTHKPFQKDMKNFAGYPGWVNIYNTGGWVVETIVPEPIHGAGVVLIDEALDVTSLRMYNEAHDSTEYMVSVEEARHGGEKSNPFYDEIAKLVDPGKVPWRSFSETVARAVRERAEGLLTRVKGFGYID